MKWKNHIKRRPIFLFLCIFAPIFGFLLAFLFAVGPNAVKAKLGEWKLLPQQDRFTELYLNDNLEVPKQINSGDTVSFSFTIHNLEGQSTTYPYAVYFVDSSGITTTIDSRPIILADNKSTVINEAYVFKESRDQVTFFISLPQQNELLHFFVPDKL